MSIDWSSHLKVMDAAPPLQVKTYYKHYCDSQHKTYRTQAKCVWPRVAWVSGEGEYALLAWCRTLTVTLHSTYPEADASRRMIDGGGCSGACHRDHEIVRIVK